MWRLELVCTANTTTITTPNHVYKQHGEEAVYEAIVMQVTGAYTVLNMLVSIGLNPCGFFGLERVYLECFYMKRYLHTISIVAP